MADETVVQQTEAVAAEKEVCIGIEFCALLVDYTATLHLNAVYWISLFCVVCIPYPNWPSKLCFNSNKLDLPLNSLDKNVLDQY